MLFVALLKTRGTTTFQEGVARRMRWDYPEGVRVLSEYWLETESPRVVSIMEADGMDAFGQIRMHWNEMFEIEVFPAVTGEQGMEMARQAMSGQATAGGYDYLLRARAAVPRPFFEALIHERRGRGVLGSSSQPGGFVPRLGRWAAAQRVKARICSPMSG